MRYLKWKKKKRISRKVDSEMVYDIHTNIPAKHSLNSCSHHVWCTPEADEFRVFNSKRNLTIDIFQKSKTWILFCFRNVWSEISSREHARKRINGTLALYTQYGFYWHITRQYSREEYLEKLFAIKYIHVFQTPFSRINWRHSVIKIKTVEELDMHDVTTALKSRRTVSQL